MLTLTVTSDDFPSPSTWSGAPDGSLTWAGENEVFDRAALSLALGCNVQAMPATTPLTVPPGRVWDRSARDWYLVLLRAGGVRAHVTVAFDDPSEFDALGDVAELLGSDDEIADVE